jgi:hypothetical protein
MMCLTAHHLVLKHVDVGDDRLLYVEFVLLVDGELFGSLQRRRGFTSLIID